MRVLVTSDLHRDGKKLLWLLDQAPEHDALFVAGDVLDMFDPSPPSVQAESAIRWRDAVLRSGRAFAWCSGNHDLRGLSMNGPVAGWMQETTDQVTGDGATNSMLGGAVVVTTVPWPIPDPVPPGEEINRHRKQYLELMAALVTNGADLRRQSSGPWIMLAHEPPGETPVAGDANMARRNTTRRILEAACPDFSFHGHIHDAPHARDGSWIFRLGQTVCFNAGQSLTGQPPNYVLLDWRGPGDWTAQWVGEGTKQAVESRDF